MRTLTVTSVSKANPAVITSTAHGLASDNPVVIAGGTADWAALNGTQIITVIDANSFSVAINSTGFALTFAGTIMTHAPQTSFGCWAIQKLYYSGSSNIRTAWAGGNASEISIWDNRASLSYS